MPVYPVGAPQELIRICSELANQYVESNPKIIGLIGDFYKSYYKSSVERTPCYVNEELVQRLKPDEISAAKIDSSNATAKLWPKPR